MNENVLAMTCDVNPYNQGLDKTPANFFPLTPLTFLTRAARVHPHRLALVHGKRRYTWSQTEGRCRRLASALTMRGITRGQTIAVMLPNIPEMYEAHFGIPMAGAVLNTLNTRLDPKSLASMLSLAAVQIVLVDREYSSVMRAALSLIKHKIVVVDVNDDEYSGPGTSIGEVNYEQLLAEGDPSFLWEAPRDEWEAISLNFTSGTTGEPKGVVYHHRGAHLNAVCNLVTWTMPAHSVYLWTLPMFHCNGWCFAWSMAANAGTNVCLRKVEPKIIFDLIRSERVTHYCGAPIVHSMLVNANAAWQVGIHHQVNAMVAGAPPPQSMIEGMERLGFQVTHVYGLTETYGPAAVCEQQMGWESLDSATRASRVSRQGVEYLLQESMSVLNPETLQPVPPDGATMGEIMFRGNITMKGYLNDPVATSNAFAGGWFHTGDLAVVYPDGYAKIQDRSKDIIISGGENISSIEIEDVICRHPDVLACAVVGQPDPKWGEVPSAYIELKAGGATTAAEMIAHCRHHLASFKIPKTIEFRILPRTATGKVQKAILRAAP